MAMTSQPLVILGVAVLGAMLAIAALFDLRSRRVPNELTVTLAATGIALAAIGGGWPAAAWAVLGTITGLAALFFPFARGWVGAGDVKLLGAIGAWVGPIGAVLCGLTASVAGGVLAAVFIARAAAAERREVLTNLQLALYLRAMPELPTRAADRQPPYAVALGAGVAVAVWIFGPQVLLVLGGVRFAI